MGWERLQKGLVGTRGGLIWTRPQKWACVVRSELGHVLERQERAGLSHKIIYLGVPYVTYVSNEMNVIYVIYK